MDTTPPPDRSRRDLAQVLGAFGLTTLLLALCDHGLLGPLLKTHESTVAALCFLYLPAWLVARRGEELEDYGVTRERWRTDLRWAAVVGVGTFVPFALGYHVWAHHLLGRPFVFRVPDDLALLALTHLVVVALPEEVFYRGFVQTTLERRWPSRWRFLGAPVGHAFWVTAVLFALGHVLVDFRPMRLGVFFPSFVFSWLRARTGTVGAATVYHAASNVLIATLEASHGFRP